MMQRRPPKGIAYAQIAAVVQKDGNEAVIGSLANETQNGVAKLIARVGTETAAEELGGCFRVAAADGFDQAGAKGSQLEGSGIRVVSSFFAGDALGRIATAAKHIHKIPVWGNVSGGRGGDHGLRLLLHWATRSLVRDWLRLGRLGRLGMVRWRMACGKNRRNWSWVLLWHLDWDLVFLSV